MAGQSGNLTLAIIKLDAVSAGIHVAKSPAEFGSAMKEAAGVSLPMTAEYWVESASEHQ